MSATERLARLLALVPWLRARPGVTMRETAAHFAISEAQLEADLNLLVCSGLPGHGPDQLIDIDFWNEDGRIFVIDPLGLTEPVRFTADEVTALLVGLRILEQVPGEHDRTALMRLAAKLSSDAPAYADDVIVHMSGPASDELQAALQYALVNGSALEIDYAGATRDEVTERVIWPHTVTVDGGATYVSAWCELAGAMRTFRADRILRWRPGAAGVQPAPVSTQSPGPSPVVIELDEKAVWFAEVHGCRAGARPGEYVLDVFDQEWVVRAVMALGGAARIVSPDETVQHLRQLASAALLKYGPLPTPQ